MQQRRSPLSISFPLIVNAWCQVHHKLQFTCLPLLLTAGPTLATILMIRRQAVLHRCAGEVCTGPQGARGAGGQGGSGV